jgi:hypothetical protein
MTIGQALILQKHGHRQHEQGSPLNVTYLFWSHRVPDRRQSVELQFVFLIESQSVNWLRVSIWSPNFD